MPLNSYSFQAAGLLLVGAVPLNNVTKVDIEWAEEQEIAKFIVAGDTRSLEVDGPSLVRCTVTVTVYDESGVNATLNQFLTGDDTTGKSKVLKIRPLGTGAGLKELILDPPSGYRGMNLQNKSGGNETGEGVPRVEGTMTWVGTFPSEVAFTAQA